MHILGPLLEIIFYALLSFFKSLLPGSEINSYLQKQYTDIPKRSQFSNKKKQLTSKESSFYKEISYLKKNKTQLLGMDPSFYWRPRQTQYLKKKSDPPPPHPDLGYLKKLIVNEHLKLPLRSVSGPHLACYRINGLPVSHIIAHTSTSTEIMSYSYLN